MKAVPDLTLDRIHGALAGVAIGDALGATVEFATRAHARWAVKEEAGGWPHRLTGGGPFGWRPGEPTDDTDLTLIVARALRKVGPAPTLGAPVPARPHYVARINRQVASGIGQWYEAGPRDVGNTTARAARRILDGESPTGGRAVYEQSNGSLMRTIAVGLAFPGDWRMVDTVARQVSAVTHAHPACMDACAAYSRAVWWLVRGDWGRAWKVLTGHRGPYELGDAPEDWYHGGGGAWDAYSLAEWALLCSLDVGPVDALIELAGLGGDADTNCAIAGGLLGAWWGHGRWLPEWRSGIETAKPMADLARYFAKRWP